MLNFENKEEILKTIHEMALAQDESDLSIAATCEYIDKQALTLQKQTDSLMPILRTALVINWREIAMKKRYDRFKEKFPEIVTLQQLKETIDQNDALLFCKRYLDIQAHKDHPEKNPKYLLLKNLTNGFLDFQTTHEFSSEIEAIRDWALKVNLCRLDTDPIGSIKGVGPAVVENIRLNLGYSVIKPDRHVAGVIKEKLKLNIEPENYIQLAKELGLSARYLDCVLFRYGKLNNISA